MLVFILAIVTGCSSDCPVLVEDITPHSVDLSWSSDSDEPGRIVYGYLLDDPRSVSTDSGPEHVVSLQGLPALTTIAYSRVDGDGTCEGRFTTNNVPSNMPILDVVYNQREAQGSSSHLLGVMMGSQPGLFVIDRQSRWLWHYLHDEEETDISDAHVVGNQILFNTYHPDREEDLGSVRVLDLNGAFQQEIVTEGSHHVFTVLPDGGLAWPSLDPREWFDEETGETVNVVGDRILERAVDGTIREVFNLWDYEEPTKHRTWDNEFYPQGHDWAHTNGLNYSAERDSYLYSLGALSVVYEVDRSTGEPIQRIDSATWTFSEGSRVFNFQHDPVWTPDGTLMMISYEYGEEKQTFVVEYEVDTENETLTQVWEYEDNSPSTQFLGQAIRLENGNTVINYAGGGLIREVTPKGEIVWSVRSPLGTWFGHIEWVDDLF